MLGRVPLLKTLLFTIVVPGTVVVLVPWWLLKGQVSVHGGWTGAAGVALVVCGAALYLRCAWDFAMRGRGTPAPVDPPRQLVVAGVYRYVRNPMYLGVLCMLVGEAALFHATVLLGYAGAFFLACHLFVISHEEPTLRRKFGPAHERYCAAVPRWFPRLTPWTG